MTVLIQNCDQMDDFDQDGDGFVSDEYAGIETLGVIGTGLLSAGDCEDNNAERNPGMEEVVADGIDSIAMVKKCAFVIRMPMGTVMKS